MYLVVPQALWLVLQQSAQNEKLQSPDEEIRGNIIFVCVHGGSNVPFCLNILKPEQPDPKSIVKKTTGLNQYILCH